MKDAALRRNCIEKVSLKDTHLSVNTWGRCEQFTSRKTCDHNQCTIGKRKQLQCEYKEFLGNKIKRQNETIRERFNTVQLSFQ